ASVRRVGVLARRPLAGIAADAAAGRSAGRRLGAEQAGADAAAADRGAQTLVPRARLAPALVDAQVVLHVLHAGEVFDEMLGAVLVIAAIHRAAQRHLPIRDRGVDIGRVEPPVLGQPVVDILADAIVGAHIALRPASGMAAHPVHVAAAGGILVADPGRHLVPGLVPPAAIVLARIMVALPGRVRAVIVAGGPRVIAAILVAITGKVAAIEIIVAAQRCAAIGGNAAVIPRSFAGAEATLEGAATEAGVVIAFPIVVAHAAGPVAQVAFGFQRRGISARIVALAAKIVRPAAPVVASRSSPASTVSSFHETVVVAAARSPPPGDRPRSGWFPGPSGGDLRLSTHCLPFRFSFAQNSGGE